MKHVTVLGAGSWGTALAALLAEKSAKVSLWARDPVLVQEINASRTNSRYLPQAQLPGNVLATADLATAIEETSALFVVVPSSGVRGLAARVQSLAPGGFAPVISCTKGIEKHSSLRMSQVLAGELPTHPIAVLSGPNHAEEIARHLPAAAVLGSDDLEIAKQLQDLLTTKTFRVYTSSDLAGIEWGGAVKNVFAIAAGLAEGLGLGDNAKAALLTRGLAEMIRLGLAMGGRSETFQGLSGVGDLIVTCFSRHSRNGRLGLALGQGKSLAEATAQSTMVAEGLPNTESIYLAAKDVGISTPIIDGMYEVLYRGQTPVEMLKSLLSRDLRPESDGELASPPR